MLKKQSLVLIFFSISFLLSLGGQAAEVQPAKSQTTPETQSTKNNDVLEKTGETIKDTALKVEKTLSETKDLRSQANYFVLGNYSPIDLIIPNKFGITLGLIKDVDKSWEFEYLKGSLSVPFLIEDLGAMTDERFSIIGRSYFGSNSFNFSYGLSYFDFSLQLGDKLLSRVTGGVYPSMDLVEIQAAGFNLAIGNRWSFNRNITVGVDWISWAQPVVVTNRKSMFSDYASNQQDKDDVDKAMKLISVFPRLTFFKIQFGMLF